MARQRGADESDDAGGKGKRRGSSRLMWFASRLLVFVLLVGVLLFFAPLLVTSTGVWRSVLSGAAPELAPLLKIESLEVAWFSPVKVRGVALTDPSGQPLAEVPTVRSQKTLLGLVLGYLAPGRHVGVFEIEQPQLNVVLRPDGSNVEDLLAKLPKSEKKGGAIGVGIKVLKGQIELDDRVVGRKWAIDNIDADAALAASSAVSAKLAAAVRSLPPSNAAGQLAVEFENAPTADGKSPIGDGKLKLALQDFPTEIAAGGLVRFVGDIRPQGPLTLAASAGWKGPSNLELVVEHLASQGLAIAAPAYLATDRPALAIAEGKVNLRVAGQEIALRELVLNSSLVQASGQATAGEGNLAAASAEIKAQVNLAELARQLPATLHMRSDMQLQSGTAEITLSTSAAGGGRRLMATLRTRDLGGVAGGREVRFDQPLEVDVAVHQTPQGPVIDHLEGKASFLELKGQGSLHDGGIQARADLNKLVAELGRLIDWGETRLAGTLASNIRWRQEAGSDWTANAELGVTNFEAIAPGIAPWKEPQLRLMANVRGDVNGGQIEQIKAAQLVVEASADRLDAELTAPVQKPSPTSAWPVKFTLRGDLASWTPRLQPFVPLGGWRMSGAIAANGNARVSQPEAEFSQVSLELSELAVDGPGVAVREPKIKVETSGAWSTPKSTLTLGSTTLASSAIAFRAEGVRVAAGKEPSVVGTIDFRGDVGRLSGWLASAEPRQSQVLGGLTGRIEIGYRGQALAANWNCDVENLKYLVAPPPRDRTALASTPAGAQWQPLWDEPRVQFAGQGTYDPATATLKVKRTSLATATANLAAAGSVSKLGPQPEVDLTGEVAYDLGLLTQELQNRLRASGASGAAALPYGLDTLQLTGKQKRQFVLKGPVFATTATESLVSSRGTQGAAGATGGRGFGLSEALAGEASLGWESAQYVGLVAGPADFRARLGGGIVSVGPLDIPLAEGRLTTAPRVLLNDPSLTVAIDRGPLLQNVRISPEMCSLWLKYVAPLVADATRAEGRFSLSLEGANVPLAAPLASDVAGTLAIQSAQIGPGPLAQQYLGMANQLRSLLKNGLSGFGQSAAGASPSGDPQSPAEQRGWVVLPEQDVLFEVHGGTVVNRGLKMAVGEVVITTEGSVDVQTQKINLVASVPLSDDWFKDQKGVLAALKGQTIKIPIDGTLTQPRLDTRALQNLGTQLAGAAVQGVIGKQLERGQGLLNRELERGQGVLNKELEKGQGLLQNEIGQGLNRLFGPRTPAPAPVPAPKGPVPR